MHRAVLGFVVSVFGVRLRLRRLKVERVEKLRRFLLNPHSSFDVIGIAQK
jgi:hypothetical protein